jgi:uncharacterized protein (TIGR00730 family)
MVGFSSGAVRNAPGKLPPGDYGIISSTAQGHFQGEESRAAMNHLCVFCGSKAGDRPVYAEAARQLGELLVRRGIGLVFGGGHIGLMGVLADAMLSQGGRVVGVIPRALVDRELAHPAVGEMHIVESMHQRKARMAELSDAFAALPGGYGTGDELFEMLTWAQLGIHRKPIGLLNTAGFFDPLLAWIDQTVREGFLKPKHRELLKVAETPERLLEVLAGSSSSR